MKNYTSHVPLPSLSGQNYVKQRISSAISPLAVVTRVERAFVRPEDFKCLRNTVLAEKLLPGHHGLFGSGEMIKVCRWYYYLQAVHSLPLFYATSNHAVE